MAPNATAPVWPVAYQLHQDDQGRNIAWLTRADSPESPDSPLTPVSPPSPESMASPAAGQAGQTSGSQNGDRPAIPHPGRVILSRRYVAEEYIDRALLLGWTDPAKEISRRFEGVDLIYSLVIEFGIPDKTYDAACIFFHRIRLIHGDKDFLTQDIAIACLFVACKSEDTLKKSRELLCAAYNMRMPNDIRTPDDKIFDKPSQNIIALERLVLEAIAFDFRVHYSQEAIVKLLKKILTQEEADYIWDIAYDMSHDLYKTYMPIKVTKYGIGFAVVELASRLTGEHTEKVKSLSLKEFSVPRMRVRQGLLDLLNLYTQHPKQTKVGRRFDLDKFIQIKIEVNKEIEEAGPNALPKSPWVLPTNEDLHSIPTTGYGQVTNRFVFDTDEAYREQGIVQQHFNDEYEEVEIEVEEEIGELSHPPDRPHDRRDHGGRGGYRGGRGGRGHRGGHGRHGRDDWGGHRNDHRRRGAPY
ncbi:hypothetical protein JX265_003765 [Neoarthrinium moseri]|uniref:RNA polymerase II holoenzyme cyclin-like subunit n=1 Tax=Neoarthrinium moseri TaxID=1658444 RepID=A0A9Q0APJ2_9PEZI|nr:uncharacterized protein JN550_002509 [Neoarthrinium moseri]KAI1843869.1 hypothetical protein JX266_009925 [Neoarthrinium moseri]KAI1875080.1 hypothetical protein JN550_002509 [Neoarthrinium moseri]KAI1877757.1 hypothetical protein JX265_003765 [Neoarthrinium moseri]